MVKRGQIVIRPSRKPDYELNELLDGITPQNLHGEFGFGTPAGREPL